MAHYDQATRDFINKVAEENTEYKSKLPLVARQIVGLAKDMSKPGQAEAAVARRVVRLATRATAESFEKNGGVRPLSIFHLLNEHYGNEWHEWESETLWQTLNLEHFVTPSEEIKNLVQALQVASKTNFPFEDFSVFENVGHAINYNTVHFDKIQPLEPDEVALSVRALKQIRPQEDFEDEVLGYIAACAKRAGLVLLPKTLFPEGSQEFLDKLDNNLELKERILSGSIQGEDVIIQLERLKEIKDYVEEYV